MDELERLKAELRAEAAQPPPGTRAARDRACHRAFRKNFSKRVSKDRRADKRLSDRAGAIIDVIRGRPIMQSIRLSHAL